MSDLNQKSRFAIDLDDLERQLRDMQAHETRQPAADPLAELAKLVGQDDPLKDVFANHGRPEVAAAPEQDQYAVPADDLRGSVDEFDAIFDRHMQREPALASEGYDSLHDDLAREVLAAVVPQARAEAGVADPLMQLDNMLSRDLDMIIDEKKAALQQAPQHEPQQDEYPANEQLYAEQHDYAAIGAAAAGAAVLGAEAGRQPSQPGAQAEPEEPDTSRDMRKSPMSKGALTAAVMVAVGVVGIGIAVVWRGGGTGTGEPRIIKAEPGPTRVQPQNQGGTEVPDQNKQIFERAGAPKPADTKVVNRDEQPVDVQAAVRNQPRVVFPGATGTSGSAGAAADAPASASTVPAAGGLGEPRRVRTVSIRPDGTVIGTPQAAAPASAAPATATPVATVPASSTPALSIPASPPPAAPVGGIVRQQAPRAVTPAAPAPSPVPAPAATEPAAPARVAVAAPVVQPRPQPQRAASAPAAETPAASGGGFAVQLAAPGSESEARSVFASLQRRFPDELGGQRPQIRKAEVNGREVYRLRVGPMSRDSAADLCTRLKGRGGQCFLAGS